MTIWLEFPPGKLAAVKNAYLQQNVRARDNPDEAESVQDAPMLDATGTRMLVGTSRIDVGKSATLKLGNAPWLVVHDTFPADWQFPVMKA